MAEVLAVDMGLKPPRTPKQGISTFKRLLGAICLGLGISMPLLAGPVSPPAGNYIVNVSTILSKPAINIASGTLTDGLKLPFLTAGQCASVDSSGKVTSIACGGGGATVAFTTGTSAGFNTVISTPTTVGVFNGTQFLVTQQGGSTAYFVLNPASVTLQGNNLSATYLTNSSATATYLQLSSATANYLTLSSATAYYINVSTIIPISKGGTGTSSPGLVAGTNIGSITGTWPNQTINALSTIVLSTASVTTGNLAQFSATTGIVDAGVGVSGFVQINPPSTQTGAFNVSSGSVNGALSANTLTLGIDTIPGIIYNPIYFYQAGTLVGTFGMTNVSDAFDPSLGSGFYFNGLNDARLTTLNKTTGQWFSHYNMSAGSMTIRNVTSQACLGTDSSGNIQAGSCSGSGASLSANNTWTGIQTFTGSSTTFTTPVFVNSSATVSGPLTIVRTSTFTSSVFLDPTAVYSSLTATVNAANSEPASMVGFLFNPSSNLSTGSDADGVVGLSEDTTAGNIQLFGVRGIDYVQGTAPQYVGTDGLVRWWSGLPGGTTSQIVGMMAEVDIAQADGVTPRSTGTVINLLLPPPVHGSGAPGLTFALVATSTYPWFVKGNIGLGTLAPAYGLDEQLSGIRTLYGVQAATMATTGTGDGMVTLTIGASTATVIYGTAPFTVGQAAVYLTTSGAVGSAPLGGSGSGTVSSSVANRVAYYTGATTVGGSSNFQWNGTSVTLVTASMTITDVLGSNNNDVGPGFVDVYSGNGFTGRILFDVGSQGQRSQFYVPDRQPVNMGQYGATIGNMDMGITANQNRITDRSRANWIDLQTASTMTFNTDNDISGGDMIFQPQNVEAFRISHLYGNVATSSSTFYGKVYNSQNSSIANETIISSGTGGALRIACKGYVNDAIQGAGCVDIDMSSATVGSDGILVYNSKANNQVGDAMIRLLNGDPAYNGYYLYVDKGPAVNNAPNLRTVGNTQVKWELNDTEYGSSVPGRGQFAIQSSGGALSILTRDAPSTTFVHTYDMYPYYDPNSYFHGDELQLNSTATIVFQTTVANGHGIGLAAPLIANASKLYRLMAYDSSGTLHSDGSGNLFFSNDGSLYTALNASNLSSGQIGSNVLPSTISYTTANETQAGIKTLTSSFTVTGTGGILSMGPISSSGPISLAGIVFISSAGSPTNAWFGPLAGNAITTGNQDTGGGYQACKAVTNAVNNTCFGFDAGLQATSNNNTLYGSRAGIGLTSGHDNVFIGYSAGSTESNTSNNFVVGDALSNITNGYFGSGITATSTANFTLNGSGGSGTDRPGAWISIAGGKGTGAGAPGPVLIQVATTSLSGTTLNSLITIASFSANGFYTDQGVKASSFTGNGSGITNLNGSNIASGQIAQGFLPSTVAYITAAETISQPWTSTSSMTVISNELITGNLNISSTTNGTGVAAGTILPIENVSETVTTTSNSVHMAGYFNCQNNDTSFLFSGQTGHVPCLTGLFADTTNSYNIGIGMESRTNSHGQAPEYDAHLALATWSQLSFQGSSTTIIADDLREEMTSNGTLPISSGGVVGLVLRQPIGSGAVGQTWSMIGMNSNPYAIGGSLLLTPVANTVFGVPITAWPATPSFRLQVNETTVNTNAAIFVTTGTSNPTLTLQNTNTQGHEIFSFSGDNQTYYLGSGNSAESILAAPNKFILYDATAGAVRWATDTSGNTIFGGTAANARLQVSGGTNKYSLAVSTGAAGPYTMYISSFGAGSMGYEDKTSSPVVTSCGTSPIITGTNNAFQVTGGGGATGCVITFTPGTFVKKPHCTLSEQTPSLTNLTTYSYTAAAITISETGFAGNIIDVSCTGAD